MLKILYHKLLTPLLVKNGPYLQQLHPTDVLAKREMKHVVCKKQLYRDMQLTDSDDEVVNNCANPCQQTIPMDIYDKTPCLPTENTSWRMNDLTANQCNIDQLISPDKRETVVRVLMVYPNLNVVVKQDFTELTKSLLKAISSKCWKTVANIILKHENIVAHILDPLRRKINDEFRQLSSDCLLKDNSPKEITAFTNEAFVKELNVKCYVVFYC